MNSNRLWPVLIVFGLLLSGTGLLEWTATHRDGRYDHVAVTAVATHDEDTDGMSEPTWQGTDPTSAEHARARQLTRRGDIEESLEIYANLVAVADAPVPLLAEYAYVLRQAHRCEDAKAVIERAQESAPDDPAVTLSAALTHRCLGDTEDARAAFERALELRPNHTPTRLVYGEFLRRRDWRERAVEVLEPATNTGTNDERSRALASLGRCLFEQGESVRGRAALNQAIERAPADVTVWLWAARTYVSSDDPNDQVRALDSATRASRLAPELPAPHGALGRAYENLGMRLEAMASYRRAVELDPDYEYALARLVRLGMEEEETALVLRSARSLLRINPDSGRYRFFYGLASARLGDTDEARASYRAAIEAREGQAAEAWYNLGLLERDAGQPEAAIEAYRNAIEVRPDYPAAWNNLGLVYYDLGRYGEAEAAFRAAINLRHGYSAAWTNMGRTFSAQDRYATAAKAYERALVDNPSDRTLRLRLGVAYRRTNRLDQAILLYRELVRDEPRYATAWYNLGIALSSAGRNGEARQAYLSALEIDPNHRQTLKNLGLLETRMGLSGQARKHLNDALDIDPTDYVVRLRLAELSLGTDDRRRCQREARVVLAQSPGNLEAEALLERCSD